MKISYIGDTTYQTILEHCTDAVAGYSENSDVILVEDASSSETFGLPELNTSKKTRVMLDGFVEEFSKVHNISNKPSVTYIYGFLGEELSDVLEITIHKQFMTGDCGLTLPYVQGTGLPLKASEAFAGVLGLEELVDTLKNDLNYRGEVCFGVDQDFTLSYLGLGHFTPGFAMYTELSKAGPQRNYEWCLGENSLGGRLHMSGITGCTLLSKPPYPYGESLMQVPAAAERHLFRNESMVFASAWGLDVSECKRRLFRTIKNCKSYNQDLQYRVDFCHRDRFLLMSERYKTLGG